MSVSFNTLSPTVRVPLFYAEVDNSQANTGEVGAGRVLLIGQMLSGAAVAPFRPLLVSRTDEAVSLFGRGSMLARMHRLYRQNDLIGEVWCLPVADNPAGVAATGSITVTGPAAVAGTLSVYVAAQRIQVAVAAGQAAASIAADLAAVINAAADLPVTASVAAAVVTLTCRWKGETGNDVTVIVNYGGSLSGEATPAGVGLAVVAMSGGSGNPSVADAVAAMGDEEYDHVTLPYTDATNLDLLRTEMGDSTGRWSPYRQVYGHVWSARRGTLSGLVSFGVSRNDQHTTVVGVELGVPTPVWEVAAAWAARSAVYLNAGPERPTQTGPLTGVLPAQPGQRFTLTEKQSLLSSGVATTVTGGGVVRIERSVTTYQKNAWGQGDTSYLDAETLFQLAYILRTLRTAITSKYPRHALANDGTRFGPGRAVVTPAVIRAELVAAYRGLERSGLVENAEAFKAALIVERDSGNPNRINVLYPPDLVNQLRIFAVLAQFRLQYPEE